MVENFELLQFSSVLQHRSPSAPRPLTTFIPPALKLRRASLILLSLILFTACPKDPPDPWDTSIFLELEKTWTTSVTLKISVADTIDNWNFSLSRDDSSAGSYTVTGPDTLIVDNGLDPDREYRYRAYWLEKGTVKDSSNEVIAITLDTTSHNFFWTIDTLGNYGSYLNDVAIVDENNIWVVGNIETDSGSFNAAHWDGNNWELMGIYSNTLDLYSICYFSENDIWVLGSYPIHWDGEAWTHYHLTDMGIIPGGLRGEIWGSNPNEVYFVGSSGRIVQYDGVGFARMESGTEIDLRFITGSADGDNVFVTGYTDQGVLGDQSVILKLNNGQWDIIRSEDKFYPTNNSEFGLISAAWVFDNICYFMTYSGIQKYLITTQVFQHWVTRTEMNAEDRHIISFKGTDLNDLILADSWGYFISFNGMKWKRLSTVHDMFSHGGLDINNMQYQNNMIVAVGAIFPGYQSVVVIGKR